MLDFVTIFTKGGIMLWCVQTTSSIIQPAVNSLVKSIISQEHGGNATFYHGALSLKYRLDNEFELVFVVGFQKILELSYVDKFLSDLQLEFRDKYKDDLEQGKISRQFDDFSEIYKKVLLIAENSSQFTEPVKQKTWKESGKSKKNIDSMVERRTRGGIFGGGGGEAIGPDNQQVQQQLQSIASSVASSPDIGTGGGKGKKKKKKKTTTGAAAAAIMKNSEISGPPPSYPPPPYSAVVNGTAADSGSDSIEGLSSSGRSGASAGSEGGSTILTEEERLRNLERLKKRSSKPRKDDGGSNGLINGSSLPVMVKKGKAPTSWDLGGKDSRQYDYSAKPSPKARGGGGGGSAAEEDDEAAGTIDVDHGMVGGMAGGLRDMEVSESEEEESEEEEGDVLTEQGKGSNGSGSNTRNGWSSRGRGMFSMLSNLVSSKALTRDDIQPHLIKLEDHLIGKNVASEIAEKLCDSVAVKLEGKVLGTFQRVNSCVRSTLEEACIQLLSPTRRIDILRDAIECSRQKGRPFTIAFCGVNGVGKSTNLAKIAFWMIENGLRVLIAACDTFRAGAVEQLRTHKRKLSALHPPERHGGAKMIDLYEKGYGKDAAGIAMEAINFARDMKYDVVLIDTAGRMQNNEPLMKSLAKLIKVNLPDLVLFVGEALVGNEAIDQLTGFNHSLADHSQMEKPRLIDGIVLSKFDTIDDKVGAAISMTYTSGQPIVFVGTGQTYTDLKNLNAKAVVHALMK